MYRYAIYAPFVVAVFALFVKYIRYLDFMMAWEFSIIVDNISSDIDAAADDDDDAPHSTTAATRCATIFFLTVSPTEHFSYSTNSSRIREEG